jgi:hypothetical protein
VKDPAETARMELWIGSVERYHERAAAARRQQWIEFHECMSELHRRLSEEHHRKAELLCEEGEQ